MELTRPANVVGGIGHARRRPDDEVNVVGKNGTEEICNGRRKRVLCRRTQGICHTDANVSACRGTSISSEAAEDNKEIAPGGSKRRVATPDQGWLGPYASRQSATLD